MARRKIRRIVKYARKASRRGRSSYTSGVLGPVMTGAVVGAGVTLASPYINQYVPSLMGVSPSTVALLGGGVVAKGVLHKGGKWADAAIVIGAAQLGSNLIAGRTASTTSSGVVSY